MSTSAQIKPKLTMDDIMVLRSVIFKDEPPSLPAPEIHYRHPLAHFDFWFLLAGLACVMATTTSMIEQYMLEPLIFTAIFFLLFALILNLSRDRQVVFVTRITRPIHFNLAPVKETLKEIQKRHLTLATGGKS